MSAKDTSRPGGRGGLLLIAWFAVSIAGCQAGEELGRVSGKVTFQGKPVAPGFVIFANDAKGVHMTAPLGPDGRYEVVMAKGFGLPLGEYALAVSPPLMDHPVGPIAEPPELDKRKDIPRRYRDPATSELKREVKSGENVFDIDLEP